MPEMLYWWIGALVGLGQGVLFAVYARSRRKRSVEQEQARVEEMKRRLRGTWEAAESEAAGWYASLFEVLARSGAAEGEKREEFEEKIETLGRRVREIEERLPSDSTLEKVSSVNDAILATNIEALTDRIKRIEGNLLTKWDVAKVVFLVIGSFAGVMSIILGVIRLTANKGN